MSGISKDRLEDEATDWFVRLRDDAADDRLRREFHAWRAQSPDHAAAYRNVELLWASLDQLEQPAAKWQRPDRRRWFPAAGIAASIALVAMGAWWTLPRGSVEMAFAQYRGDSSGSTSVVLADGTRADLDAGSAITTHFDGSARRVSVLRGRAFFDVANDARPFTVSAGSLSARDIGTSFEVGWNGELADVAVVEGIVDVSAANQDEVRLLAGDSLSWSRGAVSRSEWAVDDIAAWRSDRLVLQNTALSDVLLDLERRGAGRFVILGQDLNERRLTGALDVRDLSSALASVIDLAGAEIMRVGPVSFISRSAI